ncbi:Putative membrane protein, conserved [Thermococcus nautili]|nr:Putative membrane protein, conserved [Thermococcus nautili]
MNKKTVALIIVLLVVLAPVSYVLYSYSKFSNVINPGNPKGESHYVVLYSGGQFYIMNPAQYSQVQKSLPPGSKAFNITLKSYITGSPEVDLNLTLRGLYDRFVIVLGSPDVQECKTNPNLYPGSCQFRTAAVTEISALVSSIFSMNYYLLAKSKGYDNASAKEYAYEQTQLRHDVAYLSFWTKFEIGRGALGNEKVLTVLLIGPAEGAKCNCVYIPRKGLLVIEGTTDETLRAEIVLIENIIGFRWPEGKNPEIVSATG